MDGVRLGAICRALRIKKGWRQVDVAARSRTSRSAVSRLERGLVRELGVDTLLAIVESLGGRIDFVVRWQGGELDRLINARHSAMHESVARYLHDFDSWIFAPEVSFSIRGERGVVDILAWHPPSRTLLVIELKTEIVDVNELMGSTDRKRRLAVDIARERGWLAEHVALWLVVADSSTNRRRVAHHASTLRAAFPADGRTVKGWLEAPRGGFACLSFWSNAHHGNTKRGFATVKRVRRRRTSTISGVRSVTGTDVSTSRPSHVA